MQIGVADFSRRKRLLGNSLGLYNVEQGDGKNDEGGVTVRK